MPRRQGIELALKSLKKAIRRLESIPNSTGQLESLIEELSNTADSLSSYQDQVANEAYLGTARKRVSTRKHARLLVVCGTDLAKILAYARQKDSSMIVWVAQRFGKEHEDALDWFNESRKSKSVPLFFGVVAKLARAKDKPPVPTFKLVLIPNGWSKRNESIGHPEKAMLGEIAIQAGILEQDIEDLYENWFIETCDSWVVPYIGDLVGVKILPEIPKTSFGSVPRRRVERCRLPMFNTRHFANRSV